MKSIVFSLPGNEDLVKSLAHILGAEIGALRTHRFPDQESYVRYETPIEGQRIILVCTLDRPDKKFLPLLFAAAAARDLGAAEVGLVSPYLAYMRQDHRFQSGEAITSKHFANALGGWIDWLVTIDPHLHRFTSLSEIYPVKAAVAHAATAISAWIRDSLDDPVLIGPDSESEQWVSAVAKGAGAPFMVLEKIRRGDRDVEVSVPYVEHWRNHTPVLVDDIISTARTMIETVGHLRAAGLAPPVCVGVHAVFADNAYKELQAAGAGPIVTTNTITHECNKIDITPLLAEGIQNFLD